MRYILLLFALGIWLNPIQGSSILFMTTNSGGNLTELDPLTGQTISTNVAGVSGARGLAFGQGGLFIASGSNILRMEDDRNTISTFATTSGETAHDIIFDDAGNLYTVTNTRVHKYNSSGIEVLNFAHGMTGSTGSGNPNKAFDIAINPVNNEIFVAAKQGVRRFNPTTGSQIGSITGFSSFGAAGMAFTQNGHNNAFLYVGNIVNGLDPTRVFDSNLNFLRTFSPGGGNPIDLEVDSTTGNLFVLNSATSGRLVNQNETTIAAFGFNSSGRGIAFSPNGFESSIPEPSSLWFILISGSLFLWHRRKNTIG